MELVGSLDASNCKWRYPHCYFEVTGPDGKPVVRKIDRCPNMNRLRAKDFVKVPPSGAFNPYRPNEGYWFYPADLIAPDTFAVPGVYRVRFVYSAKSDDVKKWDNRQTLAVDAEVMDLFRQVPKVEVRSDELLLTVIDPGK
ncbi:MAG: hypothetical protein ACRC8S_19620 [Fimbriiglobus sp.]